MSFINSAFSKIGKISGIIIFLIFLSFVYVISFSTEQAIAPTRINFPSLVIDVEEGEVFDVVIGIDPNEIADYATKIKVRYPTYILEIDSFKFGDGWSQIKQTGYDLTDDTNGILIKSAEHPEIITGKKKFGTISFRAKRDGNSVITVKEDPLSFSASKQNIITHTFSNAKILIAGMHFKDLSGHWAKEYIENLYLLGAISGYDETHFYPDNEVTRAEFSKIVTSAFDIPVPEGSEIDKIWVAFHDVNVKDEFAPYILAAINNKIVYGYDDATFRPDVFISRAEATMNLLSLAGVEAETELDYVKYAVSNGLIDVYEGNLTRAELAKLISLILEMN